MIDRVMVHVVRRVEARVRARIRFLRVGPMMAPGRMATNSSSSDLCTAPLSMVSGAYFVRELAAVRPIPAEVPFLFN